MVYKTLAEMITFLEYGTKLHIGVLFFGNHGNEMCTLPHSRIIHISPLCDMFKNQSKKGYDRCFACRNLALKKAIATKQSFGDICINGIYEYTRPVIVDDEVVCIIYIGNVFDEKRRTGCTAGSAGIMNCWTASKKAYPNRISGSSAI